MMSGFGFFTFGFCFFWVGGGGGGEQCRFIMQAYHSGTECANNRAFNDLMMQA